MKKILTKIEDHSHYNEDSDDCVEEDLSDCVLCFYKTLFKSIDDLDYFIPLLNISIDHKMLGRKQYIENIRENLTKIHKLNKWIMNQVIINKNVKKTIASAVND